MLSSNCAVCCNKKSRFMKEPEAKGLLSNLGIRTPLSKIPFLGDLWFCLCNKMNVIVNKFLLAGDKFMPGMHLQQPGFTYSARGPFMKHKEFKNLCKHEIQTSFTGMNWIRLVSLMMQHILIVKI